MFKSLSFTGHNSLCGGYYSAVKICLLLWHPLFSVRGTWRYTQPRYNSSNIERRPRPVLRAAVYSFALKRSCSKLDLHPMHFIRRTSALVCGQITSVLGIPEKAPLALWWSVFGRDPYHKSLCLLDSPSPYLRCSDMTITIEQKTSFHYIKS
jgi:hypothetical protein